MSEGTAPSNPTTSSIPASDGCGLRSATAAGIDCAVVDNHFTRGGDFSGARYRIQTLGELVEIVRGDGG